MIYMRPAIRDDAVWVSEHLRPDDAREVATVGGDVVNAFSISTVCYAVFSTAKVQPLGLFGVVPDGEAFGIVWFVATPEIRSEPLSLLRESARWLDHLSAPYPEGLHNFADTRNDLHLRWCRLTGFHLGKIEELNGVPFQYIHRPHGAKHLV